MRKLLLTGGATRDPTVVLRYVERLVAGEYVALLIASADTRSQPVVRLTARTSRNGVYLRATAADGSQVALVSNEQATRLLMTLAKNPPIDAATISWSDDPDYRPQGAVLIDGRWHHHQTTTKESPWPSTASGNSKLR